MHLIFNLALGFPLALLLTQCASINPQGATPQAQREFVDAEANRITNQLTKQTPDAKKDIEESEGYAMPIL